jgi:hypothetical protein
MTGPTKDQCQRADHVPLLLALALGHLGDHPHASGQLAAATGAWEEADPARLAAFWSQLLDMAVTGEHGDDTGWATVGSRLDDRPRLTFQRVNAGGR